MPDDARKADGASDSRGPDDYMLGHSESETRRLVRQVDIDTLTERLEEEAEATGSVIKAPEAFSAWTRKS